MSSLCQVETHEARPSDAFSETCNRRSHDSLFLARQAFDLSCCSCTSAPLKSRINLPCWPVAGECAEVPNGFSIT
jgi:hypothetical protein